MTSRHSSPQAHAAAARARTQQRQAAILAPVLPEHAEAESPRAWGEDGEGAVSDEEWLSDVPPHHG